VAATEDLTAGEIELPPAIRALRGFTQIPNAILWSRKLSPQAKIAYAILLSYAWARRHCFPGQERVAAHLGVTPRTVQRMFVELRDAGLVRWGKRGFPAHNFYEILEIPAAIAAAPDTTNMSGLGRPEATNLSPSDTTNLSHEEYAIEEDSVSPSPSEKGPATTQRRARKPEPEPTGVRTLIDAFAFEHEHVLGAKYLVEGPRDGKWAKKAIATHGLARALSAVTVYFQDKRSIMRLGADIPKFVQRIGTLAGMAPDVPPSKNAAALEAAIRNRRARS
jgi:hypothetical protein